MKRFLAFAEDLLVAVAFAEAGEYKSLGIDMEQPPYCESVHRPHYVGSR